jgi:Xaa-Pro aminopeptidase
VRLTGDPAVLYLGPYATQEQWLALWQQIGLDKPIWAQYTDYLVQLSKGDMGYSLSFRRLALDMVMERLPRTALLASIGLFIIALVGWIEDVRSYVRFVTSPIEVLAEVFVEEGLDKGRVVIEVKRLPIVHYRELVQRLPGATLVPADAILGLARAIKTPAEIERLQKAAVLTEEAVYTASSQTGGARRNSSSLSDAAEVGCLTRHVAERLFQVSVLLLHVFVPL